MEPTTVLLHQCRGGGRTWAWVGCTKAVAAAAGVVEDLQSGAPEAGKQYRAADLVFRLWGVEGGCTS